MLGFLLGDYATTACRRSSLVVYAGFGYFAEKILIQVDNELSCLLGHALQLRQRVHHSMMASQYAMPAASWAA